MFIVYLEDTFMRLQVALAASLFMLPGCASKNTDAQPSPEAKTPGDIVAVSSSEPLEKGVGRKEIQFVEVTATVKSIDYKTRSITLVGPENKVMTFTVDPAVKRLNEVKRG